MHSSALERSVVDDAAHFRLAWRRASDELLSRLLSHCSFEFQQSRVRVLKEFAD